MATPLLIDADPGVDDAVALALALSHATVDLRAVVGVGGTVSLDQAMANIHGVLRAMATNKPVLIGRGREPAGPAVDRADLHGKDGLADVGLSTVAAVATDFREVYRQVAAEAGGELTVLTTGPLTNLAAILTETPKLARGLRQVVVTGGAAWAKGDVGGTAEFNFHRDPVAADVVLRSGLSLTVVPLDVTNYIMLDESHLARLASANGGPGPVLARILQSAVESDGAPGYGKTYVPAAVAVGSLLWPKLFIQTRMRLEVAPRGRDAGRCLPALGGAPPLQVNLLTAVSAVDLIENLLESLCGESFVV